MSNFRERFDGVIETLRCGLHLDERTLGLGKSVHQLCELDLHKGDVEFEVDLRRGNSEGAARVVERVFHRGGISVLFAFEEPDTAEAGKDLRVRGAVFVEGKLIL